MMPISACGKRPPEVGATKLVIIQERNEWSGAVDAGCWHQGDTISQ